MLYPIKELFSIYNAEKELTNSGKNFLSIELSLDGFSYCILDTDSFRFELLEAYALRDVNDYHKLIIILEDFVSNKKILTQNYQRVSISFIHPSVTFVPSELFVYSEKNEYLKFNLDSDHNYEIRVDKLHNLSGYTIYPLPKILIQKIDYLFPSARIRHMSTPLIENVVYMVRYGRMSPQLVLHVQSSHFEILIFNNEHLRFFNSFRYQTCEDLFYYLFYVLEQLNLQVEELDTMIFGEVGIESEFYRKIKRYVKSLSFGPRSDLYKYCEAFDEIPHHYYYNLLNLNACG